MTQFVGQEKPSLDYLAHMGVKGMRWGIRKRYTGQFDKSSARLERLAAGKGSFKDKVIATGAAGGRGQVNAFDLVASKGNVKKAAARTAKRNREFTHRLNTGQTKALDVLKVAGTLNYLDIIAGVSKGLTTKK